MKPRNLALAVLLFTSSALAAKSPAPPQYIQQLDLIHFSHTDYGFTDHPAVCRDMQRRYLDIALDAALATADAPQGERFKWTAETTLAVEDWWNVARPERREEFLRMVRAGQLEVSALPLNNTPFLDAAQWHTMTHWLPEDLWRQLPAGRSGAERRERLPARRGQDAAGSRRAAPLLRDQQHVRRPSAAPPDGVLVEAAGDQPGVMEFQFDLLWRPDGAGDAATWAETLVTKPVVVINPALPEQPAFLKYLYQP